MSGALPILRIAGLAHETAALARGCLYALAEEGMDLLDPLLRATLLDAGNAPERMCVVAPRPRLERLLRGAQAPALAQLTASGRLAVLETRSRPGPAGGAPMAARLIAELAHFGGGPRALVLLDQAEQLLQGEDAMAAARLLRDWAERDDKTVVLALRRAADGTDPSAWLAPLAPVFGGIARLRFAYGAPVWETFHWHHPRGCLAGRTLHLGSTPDGRFELVEHTLGTAATGPAADDARVLAQRNVLLAGEGAGPGWEMVEDLELMARAAAGASGATVLLGFAPGVSFDALARCVLALRAASGRRLKIVVRELNARMRQSQEALILRLGANLVVPAGVTWGRFLGLLGSVQGQVFTHVVPSSFEDAVGAALPDERSGYLPPADFMAAVGDTMRRSQALRIENALVRLELVSGLEPLDALRYCAPRRAGDLCTADTQALYVFLYACREVDVRMTLERLFTLPVSELFAGERRLFGAHEIEEAAAALGRVAAQLPDWSAELERAAAAPAVPKLSAVDSPAQNGPAATRHAAPAPAVRRPLPVRRPLATAPTS